MCVREKEREIDNENVAQSSSWELSSSITRPVRNPFLVFMYALLYHIMYVQVINVRTKMSKYENNFHQTYPHIKDHEHNVSFVYIVLCLVFVCLGFVVSTVCLSSVCLSKGLFV